MSVAVITTKHAVGDVVYWHDPEHDIVSRGVVESIEANCSKSGYRPEWEVTYRVHAKWATKETAVPFVVAEKDLHDLPRDAFPEIVELAQAPDVEAA